MCVAQFQIDLMFFSGCAIAYMSGWEIDLASACVEWRVCELLVHGVSVSRGVRACVCVVVCVVLPACVCCLCVHISK